MTTKHTIIGYQLDELDESAHNHALDWGRDVIVGDEFWYAAIFEDATEIGSILGIQIDRIYFSGFSSQGDGACFVGYYNYAKGAARAIRDYASSDLELHSIADQLQAIQKPWFYSLSAAVSHSDRYCHEYSVTISMVVDDDIIGQERGFLDGSYQVAEESITECLRDFMRWIYRTLRNEYEWQTSDESVTDFLLANEYEFDEDGNRLF